MTIQVKAITRVVLLNKMKCNHDENRRRACSIVWEEKRTSEGDLV